MCVTNYVSRRPRPVSDDANSAANMAARTPSLVSQRLMGTLPMHLMVDAAALNKAQQQRGTNSTGANVAATVSATTSTFNINNNNPLLNGGGGVGTGNSCVPNNASFSFFPPQHELVKQEDKKPRPKRRRKPQKPGKTAKQNDRHFVVHNYHDHSNDVDGGNDTTIEDSSSRKRGGVSVSFPMKLHAFLERADNDGLGRIVSWQPHGRCFVIHKVKEFADFVMPQYFRQAKLTSFQRQLNLYGFNRITRGKDSGGYYHELFLRGKGFLCKRMQRTKVKGTKFKAASSPEQEPDFYSMPPVGQTYPITSDDSSTEGAASHQTAATVAGLFPSLGPGQCVRGSDMNGQISFEPIPLGVPQLSSPPKMAPIPLANQKPQAGVGVMPQQMMAAALQQAVPPTGIDRTNCGSLDACFATMTPSFASAAVAASAPPAAAATSVGRSDADKILDDAVDELFSNDPLSGDASETNLDGLWDDSTGFMVEREVDVGLQDDLQLGYMLERILDS